MVTEYYYGGEWTDKITRKNSLVEIRKAFIKESYRNKGHFGVNIFKKGHVVGKIYEGIGTWFYHNYENGKTYEINKDGTVKR